MARRSGFGGGGIRCFRCRPGGRPLHDSWGNLLPGGGVFRNSATGREPDIRTALLRSHAGPFCQRDTLNWPGLNPTTSREQSRKFYRSVGVGAGGGDCRCFATNGLLGSDSPGIVEQIAKMRSLISLRTRRRLQCGRDLSATEIIGKSAGFAALGIVNTFNPFSKMYRVIKGMLAITLGMLFGLFFGKVTKVEVVVEELSIVLSDQVNLLTFRQKGQYRVHRQAEPRKYFFETPEQTSNFARMMGDQPYTNLS